MALFAGFGSFATLVMITFAGTWRDKLTAHAGLALLVICTAVSSSTTLAVLVTVPVAFTVLFAAWRDRTRHRDPRGAAGVRPAGGVAASRHAQLKQLHRQIVVGLRKHPDRPILRSLFRHRRHRRVRRWSCWRRSAAAAHAARTAMLAAAAGQSAVTVESGKYENACFPSGCHAHLCAAACVLVDTARRWHPWAEDRYAAGRSSTLARSAPSAAPGAACCDAAGKIELPVTQPRHLYCHSAPTRHSYLWRQPH
jgi:hypothetical protein